MALNDDLDIEEYNFSDGDISSFMEEFTQPKQDMGLSELVSKDNPYFENESEEENSSLSADLGEGDLTIGKLLSMSQAREMSKGLVTGLDSLMSSVMGAFCEGDKTLFSLDTNEKEQLVYSLALVLKHNNAHISPTWGLITTFASIYGGKAVILFMLRSEEKKSKKLKEDNEKLLRELDKYKNGRKKSEINDTVGD